MSIHIRIRFQWTLRLCLLQVPCARMKAVIYSNYTIFMIDLAGRWLADLHQANHNLRTLSGIEEIKQRVDKPDRHDSLSYGCGFVKQPRNVDKRRFLAEHSANDQTGHPGR